MNGGYRSIGALNRTATPCCMRQSATAVTTAIMQAARAVGVFVASALLLCSNSRALQIVPALAQESQCFTFVRGIATVLVCAGILVYAQGKQSAKAGPAYAALLPDKARHSFSVENA